MNKLKKNNFSANWDKKVFFKAMLLTAIAILLVAIGFISAGYFAGVFG